jgi:hypothetical protein
MLTIQNINKILHKTLGKKNFYVARVEERFDLDSTKFSTKNHKYIFELTNRKYAITVTLDRQVYGFANNYDYKLSSSTWHILYLNKKDISNMDIFIDKLRLVALG